MKLPAFLLPIILLTTISSCSSSVSVDELLLENNPGEYTIQYNTEFGLFIIEHDEESDTIGLSENWLYALYRFRQQENDVEASTSYDEFLQSKWFCLPGSEDQFEKLNDDPDAVYGSAERPQLCDCIDENGRYRMENPKCEEKFQVFRSSFNDSLSWYYSFYRDVCTGIDTSASFSVYVDTILSRSERAEARLREQQRIEDSIYATLPLHRCSGSDYIPPHMRTSSFGMYEQCRAMTRDPGGRCPRH